MVALVFCVNVIINIQTENYRGLISSKVVTCSSVKTFALQFLQEFQALSNSERFELVNNASKKSWVEYVQAFKDMNFVNLERMETKYNPADSLCHTKSTTPVLKQ